MENTLGTPRISTATRKDHKQDRRTEESWRRAGDMRNIWEGAFTPLFPQKQLPSIFMGDNSIGATSLPVHIREISALILRDVNVLQGLQMDLKW